MHKGDYHTDYSKYYDKEYKEKDLAFEHVKNLKQEIRKAKEQVESQKASEKSVKEKLEQSIKKEQTYKQKQSSKDEVEQGNKEEEKPTVKKCFRSNEWKEKK